MVLITLNIAKINMIIYIVNMLNINKLPTYIFSSYRSFKENEHHISRKINESVLILMIDGELNFEENGILKTLRKGDYYIQKPNIYQTGKKVSKLPKYYYIHFNGEYGETGLNETGKFYYEKIQDYINKLELLDEKDFFEKNLYFHLILESLLIKKENSIAEQIKIYLINNYQEKKSLINIANKFNFSENHIIRIFKKTFKVSPYQFLLNYRLEKAKQLLITTEMDCLEIAYLVGFDDYSVFYKAFKKKYLVSPKKIKN